MSISKEILYCDYCHKNFNGWVRNKNREKEKHYCSRYCYRQAKITKQTVSCKNCGKEFEKTLGEIKKYSNHFCSHSCRAIYQNTHKTKGTRISKLEIWLREQLRTLYPDEEILFNDKTTINSELDIYFPNRKLAFELNGIFHYEPIYGKEKLTQIQNNDQRKFLLCQQKNISLCVIDASKENYFKEERSKKYLNIIINIINNQK
jgi:hypothetical protein